MIQNNKYLSFLVTIFLYSNVLTHCPKGYFKLESMKYCTPWLRCRDISHLIIENPIGFGSTKYVHRALWGKFNVSLITLRNMEYRYDFHYGLNILTSLSPNKYIVQLLGFCKERDIIVTEYHINNNALNFNKFKNNFSFKKSFTFCYNYVKIISFLHNSPIGILVNCDSNDLTKLLSQLLITNDFNLVLADLDALPEVKTNRSIICGSREIKSNFVAPEQLWKQPGEFNIKLMKGYNEKTDIWKVPDVCSFFLQKYIEFAQYMLFDINLQCKEVDPTKRPTALELVNKYNAILISL